MTAAPTHTPRAQSLPTTGPPAFGRLAPALATALLAPLLMLALTLAPRAEAFVYWDSGQSRGPPAIARANPDGTGVNRTFLKLPPVGETGCCVQYEGIAAVAVDAAHVYWIGGPRSGIGRANLDGTGASQRFIPDTGVDGDPVFACDLAVEGAYVWWTTSDGNRATIGRANLDGTGADPSFIPDTGCELAVDDAHVYWTYSPYAPGERRGTIRRASLDGTGVDQAFITGVESPCGVAVDAAHVYWADSGSGAIGRANLDGTGVDHSFILDPSGFDPCALAVDAAHVYWNNGSAIGRAIETARTPRVDL